MNIGLYDADGHNFPSLPLMKISAYHKSLGDNVDWAIPLMHYDRVYVSRVFGDEYSNFQDVVFNADEVVYGGTGFAIKVVNGREVYEKQKDKNLPDEIEHMFPDYGLYPELTKNKAFGFLTRGCPNNCDFCIVSKKEGRKSVKVADLSEFWEKGRNHINIMDANILACSDRLELLQQLVDSGAWVDFSQGLDARFITEEIAMVLKRIKIERIHFAFDFMKNEKAIVKGFEIFKEVYKPKKDEVVVYMLTNYDTTIEDDLYRLEKIRSFGYLPDVRIYRKSTAPQILRYLQRWCNNRFVYRSCEFLDYAPKKDGKTIKELLKEEQ